MMTRDNISCMDLMKRKNMLDLYLITRDVERNEVK